MTILILCLLLGIAPDQSSATPLESRSRATPDIIKQISKVSPLGTHCCDWLEDFGHISIGESRIRTGLALGVSDNPGGNAYTMVIGTPTTTHPDITVINDQCSGLTLRNDACYYDFKYIPTVALKHFAADIIWPVQLCDPGGCFSWNLIGNVWASTVEIVPQEPCYECGSLINVDGRSIVESIPLAGTNIKLVYSSAMAPQYLSPYNTLSIKNAFNPHGMTVSTQHFLDVDQNRLYRGSGEIEQVNSALVPAGPGTRFVVSKTGDEVYVFSSAGHHLKTLYGLTGVDKYVFNYSVGNRLISILDAFGNTTAFDRDGAGAITQVVAPWGQVNLITLYGSGLIRKVENPAGEIYEVTYKTGTRMLETFKRPGGQISTYTYDTDGRLTKDEGHGGNYWSLSQNLSVAGNPTTLASNLGRQKVVKTFKASGQPYHRIETEANGEEKNYYDYGGGTVTESDPFHQVDRQASFDSRFGNLYGRIDSETYHMAGNSNMTTYAQSTVWPTGVTHGFWNFTSVTDTTTTGSGAHTAIYTAATKTKVNTSAAGSTQTLVIDNQERPVSQQIGSDTAWSFTYDVQGRLEEFVQGTNKKQTLTYNPAGYLSSIKNVRNEQTDFSYDLAGRVTQITLPDTRVIAYSYDVNGNITGITPPGRPQHGFTFNSFELMSTYSPPSIGIGVSKNTTYAYNNDKQLTGVTRPDGSSISYAYNSTTGELDTVTTPAGDYQLGYSAAPARQLIAKRSPDLIKSTFGYHGNLLAADSQRRPSDNFLFGQTVFAFDTQNRVSSRTVQGNSGPSTVNYGYNADDALTSVGALSMVYEYPSGRLSTTAVDRISDARTYDAYGDLVGYAAFYTPASGPIVNLYSYTLTRDSGGRISGKSETIQGTTTNYAYTYDSAGRLTLEKVNGVNNTSFTYDSNSNRTGGMIDGVAISATYDNQDRIQTLGTRTYTHNTNGDLTHTQWNTTQASSFVYDVMGNLKQVTIPTGAVTSYLADGLDRRVVKRVDGVFQFRFIYEDQYRVSAIINGSNAVVKEFVYGIRVNVPDYMKFNGFTYRIITDHLGSPRLVVRADNGTVGQRMDYNVLGFVKADTNPFLQPFGFAGGLYDPQTQLVRFGARDYDPRATGRWTTKDPIRFDGGDNNLYGYVLNDPVNLVDPRGRFACTLTETDLNFLYLLTIGYGTAGLIAGGPAVGAVGMGIGALGGLSVLCDDDFNKHKFKFEFKKKKLTCEVR